MTTLASPLKRAVNATTAANRLRGMGAGSASGSFRPSASTGSFAEGDASHQFERLASAVNDEQLTQRITIVHGQAEADPAFLGQLAQLIVDKEYMWLGVMQRVFNNPNNGTGNCDKALLASIVCKVAAKADDIKNLRSVLLSTKLSCILTVEGSGLNDAIKCVLSCCAGPADYDAFLNRMQGYENVEAFLQFADLAQASLFMGTFLGRYPACSKPFTDHQFDTALMRKGVRALNDPSVSAGALKYTLYALRFLVRNHVNDVVFAERCLSICSHLAPKYGAESAELAADVCTVLQHTTFVATQPNVVSYLLAACNAWRSTAPRKLPIAAFLARCIVQYPKEQIAAASIRIYKGVSALCCVVLPGGAPEPRELIGMLLHCTQCVLRCVMGSKYLNYEQLRQCRDLLLVAPKKSKQADDGLMDRWLNIVSTLWNKAFCVAFANVYQSLTDLVRGGVASKSAVDKHFGTSTEDDIERLDALIETRLHGAMADAQRLDGEWRTLRTRLEEAELSARQKVAVHFVETQQAIFESPAQQYFNAMILPGCKLVAAHIEHATQLQVAAESEVSKRQPVEYELRQRQMRQTTALQQGMQGASVDEITAEVTTLGLFQGVEMSVAHQRGAWSQRQRLTIASATRAGYERDRAQPLRHSRVILEMEEQLARGKGWFDNMDGRMLCAELKRELAVEVAEQLARSKVMEAFFEEAPVDALTYSAIVGAHSASLRMYRDAPRAATAQVDSEQSPSKDDAMLSLTNDESFWVPTVANRQKQLKVEEHKARQRVIVEQGCGRLHVHLLIDELECRADLHAAFAHWCQAAMLARSSAACLALISTA